MSLPATANTFGDQLKYLRRRARLTQRELALAVGYTEAHICRLEKNQRTPDLATLAALFAPALDLEDEPETMANLLKLAVEARGERTVRSVTLSQITIQHEVVEEIGALEEIPLPPPHYVLRASLLERVCTVLENERAVALCGLAGMGKTMLVASVAREYALTCPVFWLTLAPGVTTTVDVILRQLALFFLAQGHSQLRALAERRPGALPSLDQQVALVSAAASHRPALLCFDDVHVVHDDASITALFQHLIACTSSNVLMTSREDVPLPYIAQINLAGLEDDEAHMLIHQLDTRLKSSLTKRLLAKTGNSPMLLRLAAGQLLSQHEDEAEFIEHLETHPQVSAYILRTMLHDLSPSARWLASLLSVFRQPVDLYDDLLVELIEKNAGPSDLDRAIAELQRHHLIDFASSASLHPLVRDYVYTALAADASLKKCLHRVAAEQSELALDNLVEAAYHYCCAGDLEQVAEVIADQTELLFHRGQAMSAAEVVDEALVQLQRRGGSKSNLKRRLLAARGDLLRSTFRAAEAEASYREALALASAHGTPMVRAQIARSLAQSLMERGQAAEALKLCQSVAADLAPTDKVLLARLAAIECRAHQLLSHFDEAKRTAEYAIALADQFAEVVPQLADEVRARAERALGWVNYTRRPQGAESLAHYARALECAMRAGLRVIENGVLSNMATSLLERGDLNGARQSYQAALEGFQAMGDMYNTGSVMHNLGMVHHLLGEQEAALACFAQASEIAQRVGDREGLLSSEEARASMLLEMERLAEARTVLDRVLAQDTGSSDTWTLGTCLCLLVEVQLLQGELNAARSTARRVLSMPGIHDNARIRAWAQTGLALVQIAAGAAETAQRELPTPPPDDLGLELTFRWQLVQSVLALARGDVSGAEAIACAVAEQAMQKGHREAALSARRILANLAAPVTELPRRLLMGER